jgi:hypothetical protein
VNFQISKDIVTNAANMPIKKKLLNNNVNVIAANAAVINSVIVG